MKKSVFAKNLGILFILAIMIGSLSVGRKAAASDTTVESGAADVPEEAGERPFKIMVDDTVFDGFHGRERFVQELETRLGFPIEILEFLQETYYDKVEQILQGSDWPDLILLDASHYAEYAARGALWDMTDGYANASWRRNIPYSKTAAGWRLDEKLYGIMPETGNGLITYVRQEWLDQCGLEVPETYEEFWEMCEAFTTGDPDGNGIPGDTYAVTAPGILGTEEPYTGSLPEFYQDACPGFYQGEDGVWKDGFTEQPMRDALERLKEAYQKGYLDPNIFTNSSEDAYREFVFGRCGVLTDWAGTRASELRMKLEYNGLDGELAVLPPIEELGAYAQQSGLFWCVTVACQDQERALQVLGTLLDGGEDEFLWTYGIKGLHWLVSRGTVGNDVYEEEVFHGLRNRMEKGTLYTRTYLDPFFALVPLKDTVVQEPMVNIGREAYESAQIFKEQSVPAALLPYTEEMSEYGEELEAMKRIVVSRIVRGEWTVQEGMEQFLSGQGGVWSRLILDSLNQ